MIGHIVRDWRGRIVAGSASLNPSGARARTPRRFTTDQVTKDFLGLLDETVTVKVGGTEKQMPAIVAIYRKMVQMAAEGDWGAIKKVVELREKYADARTQTLGNIGVSLMDIKRGYEARGEPIPEDIKDIVKQAEEALATGQFRPG